MLRKIIIAHIRKPSSVGARRPIRAAAMGGYALLVPRPSPAEPGTRRRRWVGVRGLSRLRGERLCALRSASQALRGARACLAHARATMGGPSGAARKGHGQNDMEPGRSENAPRPHSKLADAGNGRSGRIEKARRDLFFPSIFPRFFPRSPLGCPDGVSGTPRCRNFDFWKNSFFDNLY